MEAQAAAHYWRRAERSTHLARRGATATLVLEAVLLCGCDQGAALCLAQHAFHLHHAVRILMLQALPRMISTPQTRELAHRASMGDLLHVNDSSVCCEACWCALGRTVGACSHLYDVLIVERLGKHRPGLFLLDVG